MTTSRVLALLAGLAALGACQGPQQILAEEQALAKGVALRRAQSEMNCPSATASVLSSQVLQPAAWRGLERAEYTVGVSGCGRQRVYIAVCQLGAPGCLAVNPRLSVAPQ